MNVSSARPEPANFSRIKLFLALSRTSHGILDMATPAFSALLWLGDFPPFHIILLGLMTTFAGYTAVYALNDVVDYRIDKEKIRRTGLNGQGSDLDTLWVRHPMAQGLLSFKEGVLWALGWSAVALTGAALLNPVCVLIFIVGCVLETLYCLLLKITHHRVIISGGVKTSGAIAAVFAVDPAPGVGYLICLFTLFFLWEIGGQNVPNDWTDIEEDRSLNAKTIPIRFGSDFSIRIVLGALLGTVMVTPVLFLFSQERFEGAYLAAAISAAGYLLILPAFQLWRVKEPRFAMALFNRASYFPSVLLAIVLVKLIS
ncbi:MAG: UbiA family prenyltransferase [Pseudomonadota bacterium]